MTSKKQKNKKRLAEEKEKQWLKENEQRLSCG
jgi:hypothetical protein